MLKNLLKIKYNRSSVLKERGMTLVELMVVLAIFLIVAGLTVFDYGRFRSAVSLQNLADDIALSVRLAQSYAIGVENAINTFSNGYGIHLTTIKDQPAIAGSNKSFVIFADIPDINGIQNKFYDYDQGGASSTVCNVTTLEAGSECFNFLTITSNDTIASLCPNSDPETCSTNASVDITFLRPNPNAYICLYEEGGGTCSQSLTSIDIKVENTLSKEIKTITVSNVGQISIQ